MLDIHSNGKPKPVIAAGFSSQDLAADIAQSLGSKVIEVTRRQFNDKEIQTTIEENVRGREVVVVASASGDPNKQEKEARLLMRAAGRAGAKSVTLVLPYMWYGRSDDVWDERNSPALIDTIETLREHCQSVIVADPHNHGLTRETFLTTGSPVKNCTTVQFGYPFAVQIKDMIDKNLITKDNLLLAHADTGSTKRITRAFRAAVYNVVGLDMNSEHDDWGVGMKDRDKKTGKSHYNGFTKDVTGKDVVVFEDMISSGGTACDLADLLKKEGARSVILFATNGLFTPKEKGMSLTSSVERINNSKLDAVFVADTFNHRHTNPTIARAIEKSPVIHTIKTASFLASIVEALHADAPDDNNPDQNSISAILKGDHADQTEESRKAMIAPYKPNISLGPK